MAIEAFTAYMEAKQQRSFQGPDDVDKVLRISDFNPDILTAFGYTSDIPRWAWGSNERVIQRFGATQYIENPNPPEPLNLSRHLSAAYKETTLPRFLRTFGGSYEHNNGMSHFEVKTYKGTQSDPYGSQVPSPLPTEHLSFHTHNERYQYQGMMCRYKAHFWQTYTPQDNPFVIDQREGNPPLVDEEPRRFSSGSVELVAYYDTSGPLKNIDIKAASIIAGKPDGSHPDNHEGLGGWLARTAELESQGYELRDSRKIKSDAVYASDITAVLNEAGQLDIERTAKQYERIPYEINGSSDGQNITMIMAAIPDMQLHLSIVVPACIDPNIWNYLIPEKLRRSPISIGYLNQPIWDENLITPANLGFSMEYSTIPLENLY